ncbi:MAG: hypothetical protein KF901_33185, partial [Myxococcales bacterium]|nr:hypothetical protein [Myxococcales bacterium]
MTDVLRLPDLRGPRAAPGVSGWCAVDVAPSVHVPSLDQARRCADAPVDPRRCEAQPIAFDLDDAAVLVRIPAAGATVTVTLAAPWLDEPPTLIVEPVLGGAPTRAAGVLLGGGLRVAYRGAIPAALPAGEYRFFVEGFEGIARSFRIASGPVTMLEPTESCAITLVPTITLAVAQGPTTGALPRPPLLAVDPRTGALVAAWSVNGRGQRLVPSGADVELQGSSGTPMATLTAAGGVRDALFAFGGVLVLSPTAVYRFDLDGRADPAPLVTDSSDAIALAHVDPRRPEGDILIVQRGTSSPAGTKNVRRVRPDGTELAPPELFDGRGWYAAHRSAAFTFDPTTCAFAVDPARVSIDCCRAPARLLSEAEARLFSFVADLRQLRQRRSYLTGGVATVTLGPRAPEDPLDAGRPDTEWHRVRVHGELPPGCTLELETRTSNDLLAGDPRVPGGWSKVAMATSGSEVPVASPGDPRPLAADYLVLAAAGRYLWMRFSLGSDGVSTPRITSLEVERPRVGIARFLPRVYQDSTPEDDFLRRFLALFETTTLDGVAARLDAYPELFDPRTAPEPMLPYLAAWLEMPTPEIVLADPTRLRRALIAAPEIARYRGTARGIELIIRAYTDVVARVRESFRLGQPFVLGVGATLSSASASTGASTGTSTGTSTGSVHTWTGTVLGCGTRLSDEPGPTDLDEATLGCTYLLECDERSGVRPAEFEVLVNAWDVCSSE